MIQDIKLGNRTIGLNHPPYLIAEMSGNHNQSLERAFSIIDAAHKAGAHAIKIQTYTADTMTLNINDGEFFISDKESLWKGRSLYDLYKEAYTPWEWHKPIFDKCASLGITCFSTPFDETAVDFLEELKVPFYKIASFENTCFPLLKKVAKTGKPVIVSTGMATVGELDETVRYLRENGCNQIILLKCTSSYPSTPENSNILTIPHMSDLFQTHVGLSDHTMGNGAAVASVALGARVIEKHFTLRRADGGVDSAFSLEPEEFNRLVIEAERAFQSLGHVSYGPLAIEKKSMIFRRSIYIAEPIKAGESFTNKNLRCVRPGFGLATKHYEGILGQTAAQDLKPGTPMKLEYVKT